VDVRNFFVASRLIAILRSGNDSLKPDKPRGRQQKIHRVKIKFCAKKERQRKFALGQSRGKFGYKSERIGRQHIAGENLHPPDAALSINKTIQAAQSTVYNNDSVSLSMELAKLRASCIGNLVSEVARLPFVDPAKNCVVYAHICISRSMPLSWLLSSIFNSFCSILALSFRLTIFSEMRRLFV